MPVITFDPPATGPQAVAVQNWFGVDYRVFSNLYESKEVASLPDAAFPCDLTIDPTRPETWPKAVYEAGKRDGIAEHVLVFGGPSPAHPSVEAEYGRGYIRDVMGGVAQQPAKATNGMIEGFDMRPPRPSGAFDINVRCKVCGEHDAHETMEPGFYDGREVTFVHKKCNKPPAKTLEQRVADLEARFPGELQDGC